MIAWIVNIIYGLCEFIYLTITSPICSLSIAQLFGLLCSGFAVWLVISTIKDLRERRSEENEF